MKNAFLGFLLISIGLLSSQCKPKEPNPNDQLPPITQTGANTFGCKVNGKVWIPAGKPSTFQSNLFVLYDEGYGGNLDIRTYRGDGNNGDYLSLNGFDIYGESTFMINNTNPELLRQKISFINSICSYNYDETFYRNGYITISKLDRQKGIISGTFECTMKKEGCDTLKITEGRFDLKM